MAISYTYTTPNRQPVSARETKYIFAQVIIRLSRSSVQHKLEGFVSYVFRGSAKFGKFQREAEETLAASAKVNFAENYTQLLALGNPRNLKKLNAMWNNV